MRGEMFRFQLHVASCQIVTAAPTTLLKMGRSLPLFAFKEETVTPLDDLPGISEFEGDGLAGHVRTADRTLSIFIEIRDRFLPFLRRERERSLSHRRLTEGRCR
jgi:hypothetical protein